MNKYYVSVIMPSLNTAKYISECVKSVMNQTLHDMEILCVDAGSTDGTLEILREYEKKDNRIKVILSDIKSYGYQMNLGLQNAHGKYIGIVETDDKILPDMFEKLYYQAEECQVDFLKAGYFFYAEINEKGIVENAPRDKVLDTVWKQKIEFRNNGSFRLADINHIWSGIYRRDFLEKQHIRFHETPGAAYQDTSFSALVGFFADTGMYIEDKYYLYRVNNGNSSIKDQTKLDNIIYEFEYIVQELEKRGKYNNQYRDDLATLKIDIYIWNLQRLSEENQQVFIKHIQPEMAEIENDRNLQRKLTKLQQDQLRILLGEVKSRYISEQEKLKKELLHFIKNVKESDKCIVVGAGQTGMRMVQIDQAIGNNRVIGICDNDKNKQNTKAYSLLVESIEKAVERYPDANYFVASKNHGNELKMQLQSLGIKSDHIDIYQGLPAFMEWSNWYKTDCS